MLEIKRDGGWGWLVLFFVLCSQTILGGICVSSGLFYVIFKDAFNSDPVEISWLCSLPMTLWYLATLLSVTTMSILLPHIIYWTIECLIVVQLNRSKLWNAKYSQSQNSFKIERNKPMKSGKCSSTSRRCPTGSFLTNRYGCRTCAFIGGIIAFVGLSLGFFATSTGFLFFSHGFLTGFGFGLNYTASMTVLNKYFDKFKTISTGLASIGHNAGLVIYAKFIIYLQETYSWRGMMLIHGGIALNLCACALAMFPLKITNVQVNQRLREQIKDSTKRKKSMNFSVFRKLSFISFCISNIFTNTSYSIFLLHLPSYSKDVGYTQREFGTVLIVFGITNVVGKVIYSFLGQHPRVNATALYSISLTATGVFIFLTPVFLTKAGMLTLAGLVGFFYCVTGALLQAVIYRIVGFERFADGIGMCLPFKAVGNLIGGPLAGFLFASTGNYAFSFYLSGVCMVVSSAIMIQPILHHRRREKLHKNTTIYAVCEIDISEDTKISDKNAIYKGNMNGKMMRVEQASKEEMERFLDTDPGQPLK